MLEHHSFVLFGSVLFVGICLENVQNPFHIWLELISLRMVHGLWSITPMHGYQVASSIMWWLINS